MSRSSAAASKLHHQACHLQNIKLKVSNLEVDYTCCLQKLKRHLCRKKNKNRLFENLKCEKKQRFEPTISVLFFVFFFAEITNAGRHLSIVGTRLDDGGERVGGKKCLEILCSDWTGLGAAMLTRWVSEVCGKRRHSAGTPGGACNEACERCQVVGSRSVPAAGGETPGSPGSQI